MKKRNPKQRWAPKEKVPEVVGSLVLIKKAYESQIQSDKKRISSSQGKGKKSKNRDRVN